MHLEHRNCLVHFLDSPAHTEWKKSVEVRLGELKTMLAGYAARCEKRDAKVQSVLHTGPIGESIVKMAEEKHAQMIVMAALGVSKLKRAFMGSTSSFVLHHSAIPVTVVPVPKN